MKELKTKFGDDLFRGIAKCRERNLYQNFEIEQQYVSYKFSMSKVELSFINAFNICWLKIMKSFTLNILT